MYIIKYTLTYILNAIKIQISFRLVNRLNSTYSIVRCGIHFGQMNSIQFEIYPRVVCTPCTEL